MAKITKKVKSIKKDSGMPSRKQPSRQPSFQGPAGNPNDNTFGSNIQAPSVPMTMAHPLVPMSPGMIRSIRQAPTGKIPPGLSKWMGAHGKMVR